MDFRLANLGNLVAASGGGEHHGTSYAGMLVYVGLVLAIVFTLLQLAKGGFKERIVHNWFTQRFEQLYLFIENLAVGTIGAHGKKLRLKVPDYIEAGGIPAAALTPGANKVRQR